VKNFGGVLELSLHSVEVNVCPKIYRKSFGSMLLAHIGDALHVMDLQFACGWDTGESGNDRGSRGGPEGRGGAGSSGREITQPKLSRRRRKSRSARSGWREESAAGEKKLLVRKRRRRHRKRNNRILADLNLMDYSPAARLSALVSLPGR
jgi:hypothetical protein